MWGRHHQTTILVSHFPTSSGDRLQHFFKKKSLLIFSLFVVSLFFGLSWALGSFLYYQSCSIRSKESWESSANIRFISPAAGPGETLGPLGPLGGWGKGLKGLGVSCEKTPRILNLISNGEKLTRKKWGCNWYLTTKGDFSRQISDFISQNGDLTSKVVVI